MATRDFRRSGRERGDANRRFFVFVAVFLLFTMSMVALTRYALGHFGSAEITVATEGSHEPISDAHVRLVGRAADPRGSPLTLKFAPQGGGRYLCSSLVGGTYTLHVEREGFLPYERPNVVVGPRERRELPPAHLRQDPNPAGGNETPAPPQAEGAPGAPAPAKDDKDG